MTSSEGALALFSPCRCRGRGASARARGGLLAALFLLLALFLPQLAIAHEVRPAFLEITETAPGKVDILWKRPINGEIAVRLIPHLSSGWLEKLPDTVDRAPSFLIAQWRGLEGDLAGQTLTIEGLETTITQTFVTIAWADGRQSQSLLGPANPSLELGSGKRGVLAYLSLGVEHILSGPDHLMFVLGLMLLVGVAWRPVLLAVTAFTMAHSITLALAALEIVEVRTALVEALVALSVVCLAAEVVQVYRGRRGLAARAPWLVAFTFGLLHGLAFAGALADLGLPKAHIPLALFLFNVGVEIGQLLFVGVVLALIAMLRRFAGAWPSWLRPDLLKYGPPYAIGGSAGFWCVERFIAALA